MSTHWTPEEFERHAQQLKRAVENLRNDECQKQTRPIGKSTGKPKAKKSPSPSSRQKKGSGRNLNSRNG